VRHQFNCDSLDIVMIVSLTREDLRDEFAMAADEAFALSPISARASLPSEEDYEAISEAFMETARGRWFLGEYAKRNRNADTRMVLDAVARIEQTMAAQRPPAAETDSGLAEALTAIHGALDEARASAMAALDRLALEETLAPVRKGARVIREISWRWREIGADGRICDLLDSQVSAIEAACGQLASASPQAAVSAAFDLIAARIAGSGGDDGAAPLAAEAASAVPSPAPSAEMTVVEKPAAVSEMVQAETAADPAEAAISAPATQEAIAAPTEAAVADMAAETAEAAEITAEAPDVAAEAADVADEVAEIMAEASDADDEALLEMVALEMAAVEPYDDDEPSDADPDDIAAAVPPLAGPIIVAREAEREAAPVQPLAIQPSLAPSVEPSPEPSLGSSLIANGIVRRPNGAASDPLAPLRRLSQVEKIALFS
jgi:hypothetical protein